MSRSLKTVCIAFGTRPEAIKMAPVIAEMKHSDTLDPFVLSTGQHREQLEGILELFDLAADVNLDVMTHRQGLPDLMGAIVPAAASILEELLPDYLLVHGDTLTTFALALTGFFERIPVGHVEAGLRSHDLEQPYPEEGNRRLTDAIVDVDLPPTSHAMDNLLREGKKRANMVVTGNTIVDALHYVVERVSLPADLPGGPYVTITMHRRENFDAMHELAHSLASVARENPEYSFIYPVHMNPNVREAVWEVMEPVPNIVLDDPWTYDDMIALLQASHLIITDSGGIQEEGAALDVPVAVLRDVTERPEGLETDSLRLVGNDPDTVYREVSTLMRDDDLLEAMRDSPNPFGDGHASQRIVQTIGWKLGLRDKPADWVPDH